MNRRTPGLYILILLWALPVGAQSKVDDRGVLQVSEEEIAAGKRLHDLLKKPDFITLRLINGYVYGRPVETQTPYQVGASMYFQLLVSQSLFENVIVLSQRPHYEYRPELSRDGELVPYSKNAQKAVDKADREAPSGSEIPVHLVPGREYDWSTVKLDDWYDQLAPGHYQLSVRQRFVWDGDWVESNPVIFEVEPRNPPTTIPSGVSIELVPENFQSQPRQRLYQLAEDLIVIVVINNKSDREVNSAVIDSYYGNRPRLFKDGRLLPYTEEITKLLGLKDENPQEVEVILDRALSPDAIGVSNLDLKKWYGNLKPGSYKLVNRHRFEIDGPWTAESAEMLFEIAR